MLSSGLSSVPAKSLSLLGGQEKLDWGFASRYLRERRQL